MRQAGQQQQHLLGLPPVPRRQVTSPRACLASQKEASRRELSRPFVVMQLQPGEGHGVANLHGLMGEEHPVDASRHDPSPPSTIEPPFRMPLLIFTKI